MYLALAIGVQTKNEIGTKEVTMAQKEYRNLPSQNDSINPNTSRSIVCPKCCSIWLREYAPEYCLECGAKLTDNPGQGDSGTKELIHWIRYRELPVPISKCTKCQLEYIGGIDIWKNGCLRCYGPLTQYGDYSFRYKVKKFVRRILNRR